jgi:hypothetical protein
MSTSTRGNEWTRLTQRGNEWFHGNEWAGYQGNEWTR